MNDEDCKVSRLRDALFSDSDTNSVPNITGETVTIGNNAHVVITHVHLAPPPTELTPAQKLRLSELVGSVVAASIAKGNRLVHGQVWRRFQRHFQVNTYHALPPDQFSAAEAFLKMLYARAKRGDRLSARDQ